MNKKIIKVPKGIKMLSEWTDFLNNIPDGKVILNKKLTGCGATTLFLKVDKPLILCAHRSELLSCKSESDLHKSEVCLFKDASDTGVRKLMNNISNLNTYLDSCQTPKILVTVDSLHNVIDVLEKRGELKNYCVVSDEMQCIFTDSVFKGDTVFKYLNDLEKIDNVIFLSATPYMETYLDQLNEFKNLLYVELDWESEEPGRVIKPNIKTFNVSSLVDELNKIIEKYKINGYFESKAINGVPYKAEQGIFYLNSVEDITKAIKSNKLSPEECNIICSKTNKKSLSKLKRLGFTVGSVQKEGEPHKTFTFVTKCAFEGVDMYHPSGVSYIFADPNLENLSLDISIDIEQIMGRQRLESNVFRYDAIMFFKTTNGNNIISQEDFDESVKNKTNLTLNEINSINSITNAKLKSDKIDLINVVHNSVGFKKDYISFYTNPITNELEARENILVKISEYRAWEIRCNNYFNQLRVISGINKICGDYQYPIDELFGIFYITKDFPTRMKAYCDFLESHPGAQDEVEQKSVGIIDSEYHTYYRKLGLDKIRANSYQHSKLELLINAGNINIKDKILEVFKPGTTLSKKEIKESLQNIYNNLSIKKTAKATDLEEYFEILQTKLKDKGHCFKILKEK